MTTTILQKKGSTAFYISLAVVMISVMVMNALTPEWLDDYLYKFSLRDYELRIENAGDLIGSIQAHYFTENGRVIVHAIVQLFTALIGKSLFNACNSIAFVILILEIIAFTKLNKQPSTVFFLSITIMLLMPRFYETGLWMTGSVNYLWSSCACLGFLLIYRHYYDKKPRSRLFLFILCITTFLLGEMHEGICLPLALSCSIVLAMDYRRLIHKDIVWITSFFLLGSLFCALSPATIIRGGMNHSFSVITFLTNGINLLQFKLFLVFLFSLTALLIYKKRLLTAYIKESKILILSIFFSSGIVMVSGFTSARTGYGLELFSLLSLLLLLAKMKTGERLAMTLNYVSAVLFISLLIPTIHYSIRNHREYTSEICQIKANKRIIATNEVKMPFWINPLVCTPTIRESDDFYNCFNPQSKDCQWMAHAFGSIPFACLPEAWLRDIKEHPDLYDNFDVDTPFPFYSKRINNITVKKTTYILRPTDYQSLPFYIRPFASRIGRYNTTELEVQKWCVVNIDSIDYLLVARSSLINDRVESIKVE